MRAQWGDVATWVAGLSTAGALVFAGVQVRMLRAQAANDREVEQRGVVVSWRAPTVPREARSDGKAQWTYVFVAHNPGRLPIRAVQVEVAFPMPVQRRHYDGHVGRPTHTVHLATPVIAGGDHRDWRRHLLIPFEERRSLGQTTATISFTNMDGTRLTNDWSGIIEGEDSEDGEPDLSAEET